MDQPTLTFLFADLVLIGVFCALLTRAEKTPQAYWRFLVGGLRTGPNTLATQRTPSGLFYSGLRSFTWGFILVAFLLVTGIVMDAIDDRRHPHILFTIVMFGSGFIAAMCFVAGTEQFVRSAVRRIKEAR